MSYYDNHLTDSAEEKWSRFCMLVDVAVMVYEEDQRRLVSEKEEEPKFHSVEESHKRIFNLFPRKTRSNLIKRRYTQQNPNRASTSSLLLDLNKTPPDSETENPQNPSSELVVYDEEQRIKKGKAKIVSQDYEEKRFSEKKFVSRRRYPQQQNYVMNLNGASTSSSHLDLRCFESSLVLFDYEKTETKDPPNPNYQTLNTNRKRHAVKQRKNKDGFKKAKIASFPRVARETPEWVFQMIRDMNGYDVEEEPF